MGHLKGVRELFASILYRLLLKGDRQVFFVPNVKGRVFSSKGGLASETRVEESVFSTIRSRSLFIARSSITILTRRFRSRALSTKVPRLVGVLRLGFRRALRSELFRVGSANTSSILSRGRTRIQYDWEASAILVYGVSREGKYTYAWRGAFLSVYTLSYSRGFVIFQLNSLISASTFWVVVSLYRRDEGYGSIGYRSFASVSASVVVAMGGRFS